MLDTQKLFPQECQRGRNSIACSFCNAYERAYAGVVYFRTTDTKGITHISLVVAKTKVAPIKQINIPELKLCGALVMARSLKHTSRVLSVPTEKNIRLD